MSADFRFKRFVVTQQLSAMKVGTDGVLLGAWTRIEPCHQRVLDVGTGTGVVALMLAQRSEAWGADVVGVEIDAQSASEAAVNFAHSPWNDRLAVQCEAVQEFRSEEPFDLIVSNPPYFVDSLHSPDAARTTARHTTSLSFDALAACAARLLTEEGSMAVVLPYDASSAMTLAAARSGLFVVRRCDVRSKASAGPIRVLMELGRHPAATVHEELVIHSPSGLLGYSDDYVALTKDFYLKF